MPHMPTMAVCATLAFAQLSWIDGDTGRLSDGTKFRLHGIDAPETHRPRCTAEAQLGALARAAAETLSATGPVRVTRRWYTDRYGRLVIDLEANGRDVASALVENGYAQTWDYDGGEPQPSWCAVE